MRMALLRVGIDSGSGGIQGPLFMDGSFDFVCIPDRKNVDPRTYGNTSGVKGPYVNYFPRQRQADMACRSIHVDPEFETFTYGDPTSPKAGLRKLISGDMLVFYAGLQGFEFPSAPALYLIGYFEVINAGKAADFSDHVLHRDFGGNFHVRHPSVFELQKSDLVLVRGGPGSRLLKKAHCLSAEGCDRNGKPLKVISAEMQQIFGDFGGRISMQRSPTRWVDAAFVPKAAQFVRSLP